MKTLKQILTQKGSEIYSTTPSESIISAIKLMAEKKVGALLVLENNQIKGIVSEQDFTRKVILKDVEAKSTSVQDVMTTQVAIAKPTQTINEAMAIMTNKRIRHLPVIENDQLIGLISIGDLVKEVISEQNFIIKQLEHYIYN